ncbi:UNVERIFIED_CONTAM: hypothetical protein Sradi_6175800 [Sesamum radiatum]|uniref:Retrotransposon gag domain-containing protein n=1 Tax=Sesamum radiatum TaxID=300843 RepID=A0AAW2K8F2_SESRA
MEMKNNLFNSSNFKYHMPSLEASSQQNNHVGASRDDGIALPLKFALKLGAKRKAQVAENDLLDDTMTHSSSHAMISLTNSTTSFKVPQRQMNLKSKIYTVNEAIAKTYETRVQAFKSYVKPYTRRIEQLRMPENYQPPKFQQFNGHGDPRQHIAHFVETCNDAGTDGDLLVKQFLLSLKDTAFNCARRTVSMTELANQHQEKDEPVLDYINNWRNLSLSCKDALSEISAVELCIQGMHWELCYILKAIKPKTFGELATRAHGIEMSFNCKEDEYLVDASEDDGDDDDATP